MKKLIKENDLAGERITGITNGKYWIKETASNVVDELVKKYHYNHKATKNRFLSFLVNDRKGFLQLGYGIRPRIKHTISSFITKDNYCEFDRMWLSDDLPKYSESIVIGLLLSYIKQVYSRIKFIITYADSSVGNKGTIYKATNAFDLGHINVDFYLLPNGERVHPVSMYHRHGTRAKDFLDNKYKGIKHIKGNATNSLWQHRFLYILNRSMRNKFQERNAF